MPSRPLSHLYCFLAILFWSTIELGSKALGAGVSPYTLTAWRFLIGGLVILPFALKALRASPRALKPRDLGQMALLGVLNVCVSMLFLQMSVYYGKASVSAVLVSSNPLFVSVFALLILREKLSLPQLAGLALALGGIALLILGEGDFGSARYLDLPLSIGFGLGCSLTFGLYTVLTKRLIQTHGNTLTNSVSFLAGAAVLFLYNALAAKPLLFSLSWKSAGIMLYLGAVVSGLAYLLFFEGMKRLGAAPASMYFFLKPVLASLLAVLILGETLAPLQAAAILVIVTGLTLSRVLKRGRSALPG
ncbi:MAG: DMT family transporter [Candidatus Cloacimonetes bacterium]|nr:DMT family transporter [Candidatus Cloacimonadota bacterium]